MTGSETFSVADQKLLAAAGITPEAAARQLTLLREGMHPPHLLRPCTVGDGIEVPDSNEFDAIENLGAAYQKACAEGRWMFFIPASGAATRMVASLSDPGDPDAARALREHANFTRSALPELLKDPAVWATLPKALMPFHRSGSGDGAYRTPIEEHIREAAALAPGTTARLHFTISPEHEKPFLDEVGRVLNLLRAEGTVAEVTHSFQDPATQTLALDEEGQPFRDVAGNLLLRPGGHGSLLRNLENVARDHGADFVWIRNIDNIPVEPVRAQGRALRRAIGGILMRTHQDSYPPFTLPGDRGGVGVSAKPTRPTRVAGMVKNVGEPGGGPFWIQAQRAHRLKNGPEVRIVESAEVDAGSPEQGEVFRAATHFNPVDLACALRDSSGKPFSLEEFSDPSACFVADKSHEGRPLKALEWPGLWNGAMAGWNTRCVEIPLSQFAPVKTVADLLRAEHAGV